MNMVIQGQIYIFRLSYKLTSDDLWPWYMTFDLINKWGFPCCIYDPTLIEIHQSMWKIESNVNPFFSQQTPTNNNYSGQRDPSFLLTQATQKLLYQENIPLLKLLNCRYPGLLDQPLSSSRQEKELREFWKVTTYHVYSWILNYRPTTNQHLCHL